MNFPALIIPSSATSPANLYKRIIIQDDNIIMDTPLKKIQERIIMDVLGHEETEKKSLRFN
jgi:hypothetical protein